MRSVKRKFKNKKLSESKIQKWQEQTIQNIQKYEFAETEREEKIKSAEPQIKQWLEFIKDVITLNYTNRIGVLLHDYSGKHGNKINLQGKEKIKSTDLTSRVLLEVQEDTIYEFIS